MCRRGSCGQIMFLYYFILICLRQMQHKLETLNWQNKEDHACWWLLQFAWWWHALIAWWQWIFTGPVWTKAWWSLDERWTRRHIPSVLPLLFCWWFKRVVWTCFLVWFLAGARLACSLVVWLACSLAVWLTCSFAVWLARSLGVRLACSFNVCWSQMPSRQQQMKYLFLIMWSSWNTYRKKIRYVTCGYIYINLY